MLYPVSLPHLQESYVKINPQTCLSRQIKVMKDWWTLLDVFV
jgi:hypothetical protein